MVGGRGSAVVTEPVLLHFSEDPSIEVFEPHVAATAAEDEPLVWAVDDAHQPMFWFPRQCPRATFWRGPQTSDTDADRLLLGSWRVHAIEWDWLERVQRAELFVYSFDSGPFERQGDPETGYWVTRAPVRPVGVSPVGDLLARHAAAGIELRLVTSLWPLWDQVAASTLRFSGSRLRNARPRPAEVERA